MIAKGKSISHGAAMMDYAANRETSQLVTYNKLDLDFEKTFGLKPDNVWEHFKVHAMRHAPIENSLMRFEISLAKDERDGMDEKAYQSLLTEFIDVFDNLRTVKKKDKHGKLKDVKVKPTNLKNSQWIAFYHQNTDDPHLHFLVNRIDENGNVNDDSMIMNRAMMAAEIINQRRGWKSTLIRHDENIGAMKQAIFDVLKQMDSFSWGTFVDELKEDGIDCKLRNDKSGNVVGYSVKLTDGHSIYNASEISDSLTAKHIEATWNKLHDEYFKETLRASVIDDGLPRVDVTRYPESVDLFEHSPTPPVKTEHDVPRSFEAHDTSRHFHKIAFGFYSCEFSMLAYIEDIIRSEIHIGVNEEKEAISDSKDENDMTMLKFLSEQFDFDAAFQMAQMLFIDYVTGASAMSNYVGGAGGGCTSGWSGKKKDDDDEDWARKCARMAVKMSKPWKLSKRRGRKK